MSDAPNLKIKSLELANQHMGGTVIAHDEVVKRAVAYHAFLSGTAAAPSAAKPAAGPAAAPKAAAATPTAVAAKPGAAAAKPGAAIPKPVAAKPGAAAQKPAAASGKPAAATPQASDDGLVMDDVSAALQKVLQAGATKEAGKEAAYKILKDIAGADSVRNVKPDKYAAVIAACGAAAKKPAAKAAAKPTAQDDFGATADDGADGPAPISADDEVDTDPPEQTGAGESADGEDL